MKIYQFDLATNTEEIIDADSQTVAEIETVRRLNAEAKEIKANNEKNDALKKQEVFDKLGITEEEAKLLLS